MRELLVRDVLCDVVEELNPRAATQGRISAKAAQSIRQDRGPAVSIGYGAD
jgi:hypothetical protein